MRAGAFAHSSSTPSGAARMLESIRKRTGSLLVKGLLGLLVVSFALWGIGDVFQAPRDLSVAEVGGVGVPASALQAENARIVENLRRTLGLDAEQARAFGALETALDRLIDRETARLEAEAVGVGAPDDAVLRAIEGNAIFHNVAGRFDRALYGAVLARNRLTPTEYEDGVRQDIARAQLADSLAVGANPPAVLARTLLRHERQERTAEALTLAVDSEAPPEPGEAELQAWFGERRADYTTPEYRRITAAVIRPADFLDEVEVSEEELRAEYDYRIEEFIVPARRAIDQMVFPGAEAAEAARERLAGGAGFHALGAELLDLSPADMDLGMRAEDELATAELGAAAFAAPVGEAAGPVETPFGWAVVRAREEAPGSTRPFAEAAETLRRERKIALAQDLVADLGDEFEDARAGGATLEEAARAVGVATLAVGPVDRFGRLADGGAPGAAPPPIAEFLDRAFAAKPDEETPLHDTEDGSYFTLRVVRITPPAERSLDEAREEAVADWRADRLRADAVARAEAIAERLRGGAPVAEVAAGAGAAHRTAEAFARSAAQAGDGLGPAFVAAAFALEEEGGVSDPVVEGDRVHVVRVTEIRDVEDDDLDSAARSRMTDRLAIGQAGDIAAGYSEALRRKYGVAVNRGAIARFFEN